MIPQLTKIILLSLTALTGFLVSISPFSFFIPQIIALISIILVTISIRQKTLNLYLVSLLINLIVFGTNSLNSPLFFLIYFLLFVLAFHHPPSVTLAYSLFLILLLSQSLNSVSSLIPLFSLTFISPLAWYVGRQYLNNQKMTVSLAKDETSVFLFFSLNFKNHLTEIMDSLSLLQSDPKLTPTQKNELTKVKNISQSLLESSQKLTQQVDQETDEG